MSSRKISIPASYYGTDWHNLLSNHSGHWFDKVSMRFFSSRISWASLTKVSHNTWFFVSSEQFDYRSPRKYSVHSITVYGDIGDVSEFQQFDTLAQAKRFLQAQKTPFLIRELEEVLG